MKSLLRIVIAGFGLAAALLCLARCPGHYEKEVAETDSTSASEIAMAVIAGAVNATSPTGSRAEWKPAKPFEIWPVWPPSLLWEDKADAQVVVNVCPSLQSNSANCTLSGPNNDTVTLSYGNCQFNSAGNYPNWSGTEVLVNSGSTAMTCGSFPSLASGDSLTRTFGNPTDRMSTNGVTVLLDNSTVSTGWQTAVDVSKGETIAYTGSVARNITVNGFHIVGDVQSWVVWDYTVTSTGVISVDSSNSVAVYPTSSALTLQNDTLSQTVTSKVTTALTFSAGCCYPTGGQIQTYDSSNNLIETLNFTGACGAATLNSASLTLNQCF